VTAAEADVVSRRFLVLTALRWAPVGLMMPVLVLLPLDRGLTLSQLGLVAAAQGLVVLLLELPTGGMADSLGRRPVLLAAGVIGILSTILMLLAQGMVGFALAFTLQGVYRALDSGPLEAWYVDATHAAQADRARADDEVARGLSRAGAALGIAIAAGSLGGAGLVALGDLGPLDALAVPLVASLVLQVAGLGGVLLLMSEIHRRERRAAWDAVRAAPRTIGAGLRLLRTSPVLLAIVAVELSWGFGSAGYEGLVPVRLTEVLAEPEAAAVVMGPAGAGAWLLSAVGAASLPLLSHRIGTAPSAALLRVIQGAAVAAMGLVAGVVGVVAAYLVCYTAHGAANPAHMALLHREVDGSVRATAVSINSMVAQAAGAVGAITLTAVADRSSAGVAMYVAAGVLAAGAPLYLPAWRRERRLRRAVPVPADAVAVSNAPEASSRS
jgi:MFS family permease